jgi:serine/threonine-protein kinase
VSPDVTGKIIAGKYELLVPAGEGGMAVVWKAIARGAGAFAKQVAVKRIQAGKTADPSFIKMFEEEARVGSQLEHPNIVHIMDFGVDEDGGYYLVMEWCEGLDMFQWVRSHSRPGPDGSPPRHTPWPLVAAIGVEVTRGLAAAHERVTADGAPAPVYHRDVSPSNILLGVNGTVKLTDFGLARAMDRASMTRPNVIKGKLAYCAPELITGAKPSPATDVFALGVVLWEALAQRRLFVGKNDLEVLLAVRKGDVPDLNATRPDLPRSLVDAVNAALAHDLDRRFQDARAMARAMASALREASEAVDAEPLGTSVKAARKRLGKVSQEYPAIPPPVAPSMAVTDPKIRIDPPPPPTEIDELSASDVEAVEPRNTPKGLWTSEGSSAAVPLTQKKK